MGLRFGLLGAGRIGTVHAAAVAGTAGAELVAVADAIPKAAEAIAKSHGAEVRTVDAIMNAKDVEAVLITTPTDMHADMIEQAARAGKAIFCEKPIDLSVDRVRRCLEVVRAEKAPLMIGFNRRFDPNFKEVRADRRRRHRRSGNGVDHLSRSLAAASHLCGALGGLVPRHDDPRLRHGGVPFGRGSGIGVRRRLQSGRPRDRRGGRRRQRQPGADHQVGKDRSDFQFTAGDLRLRSAYRGSRFERSGVGGKRSRHHRRGGRRRRVPARAASEFLHDALYAGLRERDRRIHRRAERTVVR